MQQPSTAVANPFQTFCDNPFQSFFGAQAFGGLDVCDPNFFGNASDGSMVCHASCSFAQQGPDGVQYSQSQSSSYGPKGVSLLSEPHASVMAPSDSSCAENVINCRLLSIKGV